MQTTSSSRSGSGLWGRDMRALRGLVLPVRRARSRQRSALEFMILASLSEADLRQLGVTRAEVEADLARRTLGWPSRQRMADMRPRT